MISFEHVTKAYGAHLAMDDVSISIDAGEFCALLGPSGAGKSTALRLVNRMIEPDSGRVLVGRADVVGLDPVALRRRLGYVIQSVGLFPHWTVGDNVATVPRLLRWPAAKVAARVDELLSLVGLEPALFRNRHPVQLSGGQQQRVGVARALAADPEVLLMDEPFGALDVVTRATLQEEMAAIHATTGKTVLMVTHDVDEALRLASRVVVMEGGRVVQNCTPRDLLSSPANPFVERLIGGEAASFRLLRIRRVSEIATEGVPAGVAQTIGAGAGLDAALARMLSRGIDVLAVTDANGAVTGSLRLADVVQRA
jgi:osmoprotectant transport system ATP-binding protein